jgi:hypothetical protein
MEVTSLGLRPQQRGVLLTGVSAKGASSVFPTETDQKISNNFGQK